MVAAVSSGISGIADKRAASVGEISAGFGVMVSMVTRFDQIGEALDAGKSSRQIAKEFKLSLRDVQKVRADRSLDLGAKQREHANLQKAIAGVQKSITALELELQRLDEQLAVRKRKLADLNNEIARKRQQRALAPVYVDGIHIPPNDSDVRAYLAKLDLVRLKWFTDTIYSIIKSKQQRELEELLRGLE